ncbi:hypothetical protein HK105_206326 [Polyrhizophydium stewartii]|uniref:Senescence domain-containing protein n=1 Tax=Polyrhizophydium stewartii TaxID=2732419 RepID=A0ABR4N3K8_9FUNG
MRDARGATSAALVRISRAGCYLVAARSRSLLAAGPAEVVRVTLPGRHPLDPPVYDVAFLSVAGGRVSHPLMANSTPSRVADGVYDFAIPGGEALRLDFSARATSPDADVAAEAAAEAAALEDCLALYTRFKNRRRLRNTFCLVDEAGQVLARVGGDGVHAEQAAAPPSAATGDLLSSAAGGKLPVFLGLSSGATTLDFDPPPDPSDVHAEVPAARRPDDHPAVEPPAAAGQSPWLAARPVPDRSVGPTLTPGAPDRRKSHRISMRVPLLDPPIQATRHPQQDPTADAPVPARPPVQPDDSADQPPHATSKPRREFVRPKKPDPAAILEDAPTTESTPASDPKEQSVAQRRSAARHTILLPPPTDLPDPVSHSEPEPGPDTAARPESPPPSTPQSSSSAVTYIGKAAQAGTDLLLSPYKMLRSAANSASGAVENVVESVVENVVENILPAFTGYIETKAQVYGYETQLRAAQEYATEVWMDISAAWDSRGRQDSPPPSRGKAGDKRVSIVFFDDQGLSHPAVFRPPGQNSPANGHATPANRKQVRSGGRGPGLFGRGRRLYIANPDSSDDSD